MIIDRANTVNEVQGCYALVADGKSQGVRVSNLANAREWAANVSRCRGCAVELYEMSEQTLQWVQVMQVSCEVHSGMFEYQRPMRTVSNNLYIGSIKGRW